MEANYAVNPKLFIIAGPNGAGKTTFAGQFLPRCTSSREFLNADEIARRISPSNPEAAAFPAGREMLERISALASQRADFAIETTLSGKSYAPLLRKLKASGYEIHLCFLWLPDVQMAIERVADRVRKGGHDIPEPMIRRRYAAGIKNLFNVYRPILNSWTIFDNSRDLPYPLGREKNGQLVLDTQLFEGFFDMRTSSTDETLQESASLPYWMPMLIALRLAKAEVIREHCKTGHPLIVWRDGKVYRQPPEEAQREMEEAMKNDPWRSVPLTER
jgi:predicted ABC-type ATPase